MRDFSKVSPKVWRSPRFRNLEDDDARLFYLFLLTCEHQSSAGCFRLPDAYAAADLVAWTPARLAHARASLVAADLIVHDATTDEYFVGRWLKHNPPTNQKHLTGVQRLISELDSDAVREAAEADLADWEATRNPLEKLPGAVGHHLTGTAYFNGKR